MELKKIIELVQFLEVNPHPKGFNKQISKGLRELATLKMKKDVQKMGDLVLEKNYNPTLDRSILKIYTKESHKRKEEYLKELIKAGRA